MNIQLHVEQLVLDGLSLTASQGPLVQAALEAEMSRLLAEGGLAPGLLSGGTLPGLPAASIELAPQSDPATIGRQIAQSVHGGIGP